MDLRLLATVFGTVFLAELGDLALRLARRNQLDRGVRGGLAGSRRRHRHRCAGRRDNLESCPAPVLQLRRGSRIHSHRGVDLASLGRDG